MDSVQTQWPVFLSAPFWGESRFKNKLPRNNQYEAVEESTHFLPSFHRRVRLSQVFTSPEDVRFTNDQALNGLKMILYQKNKNPTYF